MAGDSYLSGILAHHRARAAADRRSLAQLADQAARAPGLRAFADSLARGASEGLAVIAEVKRRSPSRGDIDPGLDPAATARQYAAGGASCLSVLTDGPHFGGNAADLGSARSACPLPVLRKDFTVSQADVYDARIMGADAVLLIVAALDDDELAGLHELAGALGLDALVEVHDEAELQRALALRPRLVGVNQRDLRTFDVDGHRAAGLAPLIPEDVVAVAESGIAGADDARALAAAGYQAVLVGESLLKAPDRRRAVAELRGHRVGSRPRAATAGVQGQAERE